MAPLDARNGTIVDRAYNAFFQLFTKYTSRNEAWRMCLMWSRYTLRPIFWAIFRNDCRSTPAADTAFSKYLLEGAECLPWPLFLISWDVIWPVAHYLFAISRLMSFLSVFLDFVSDFLACCFDKYWDGKKCSRPLFIRDSRYLLNSIYIKSVLYNFLPLFFFAFPFRILGFCLFFLSFLLLLESQFSCLSQLFFLPLFITIVQLWIFLLQLWLLSVLRFVQLVFAYSFYVLFLEPVLFTVSSLILSVFHS